MDSSAPNIPESLRQTMAEIGPIWGTDIAAHSKLMLEGFSSILANAPKLGKVERDICYGPHSRHLLDIYSPSIATDTPVVVFAHGGAFVDGNKDRTSEVYSNVCWYLARHGITGINIEYRVAKDGMYPSATEDFGLAVTWVRANVSKFKGNPEKIFAMGHSAGACHSGLYVYNREFHPPGGSGIKGFISVSGRVRIETLPENPNARKVEAYFGTDPKVMELGSVVNHISKDSVPIMIALAEYENPLLDVHGAELFYRMANLNRFAPRLVWLAGHNHNSAISHINTSEDLLGRSIVEFIRKGC